MDLTYTIVKLYVVISMNQIGTIVRDGNVSRINNAFIENVVCFNNSGGFILISHSVNERNDITSIRNIRLNINRNTVILNNFGQRICPCCLRPGMWVNVVFSSRMTNSIPPQSNALFVVVQRDTQPAAQTTVGRIVLIDFDNRFIYTEDPNNRNNQTKFIITNATTFTNRFGAPIRFEALNPGQMVRITHANFMTASIPPQTTAFNIRII
jgi:hypothetical protein